jgi:hypothetical protein
LEIISFEDHWSAKLHSLLALELRRSGFYYSKEVDLHK